MNKSIVPLILSGGNGTRLWPISNAFNPKQFMDLGDGLSMLQNTLVRLKKIKNLCKPIILCNSQYEIKVIEQLKKIGIKNYSIIVEPIGRSTAPALTSALLVLNKIKNRDYICLIIPSDHHISNIDNFNMIVQEGSKYARDGHIVTFGVVPQYPETGYGYIKKGTQTTTNIKKKCPAFFVEGFAEKPDIKMSTFYFNSGEYFWNSGIFMFRSSYILEEFKHFTPEVFHFCKLAVDKGISKSTSFYLEKSCFSQCPNTSIDHAVMENTDNSVVIPMSVGWKDLGSWESLLRANKKNKDVNGNILKGNVIAYKTKNSYVRAESRLVTTVGVSEHVIIETVDSILVVPLSKTQDVKKMVLESNLHEMGKNSSQMKEYHQWGTYEKLVMSEGILLSLIVINPNSFVNIEQNFKPEVNWIVTNGEALVSNGDSNFYLNKKDFIKIRCTPGYIIYNSKQNPLKIIELKVTHAFKQVEF